MVDTIRLVGHGPTFITNKDQPATVLEHYYSWRAGDELLGPASWRILQGVPIAANLAALAGRLAALSGCPLVWIGTKEVEGSIHIFASPGEHQEYVQSLQLRWDETSEGNCPPGLALRLGLAHKGNQEEHLSWQERARQQGFLDTLSLPLRVKDQVVGVATFYALLPGTFNPERCAFLSDLADGVGLVLHLAQEQQQLRLQSLALATAANAIFLTDCQGHIVWANDAFCRLSGFSQEELIGNTPRLLKSGKMPAPFYEHLWQTIQDGKVWHGEVTDRRKDGSFFVVQQTVTPVRDAQGKVSHFFTVHEDLTPRRETEAHLEHLAYYDALTNLPNRIVFRNYLPLALAQARRSGRMLSLMFLDLDQFKSVNDKLGHAAGDALLKAVAERLQECLRETDIVARLSGDEFAILQANLPRPGGSVELAQKILRQLAKPFSLEGRQVHISTSIGITLFPLDQAEPDQMMRNADLALYRAKKLGRNRYQFFSPQLNAELLQRQRLEEEMRQALVRHEFLLYYQPQIAIPSGRVVGLEALLRWQHPERGLLGPPHFLPVAEDCNLIVPLGRWTLRQACLQNRAWQAAGLATVPITVNISTAQFKRDHLLGAVTEALEISGLQPHLLDLDVSESLFTEDIPNLAVTLEKLHQMGIRITLDNFGTGLSSWLFLHRLPFHKLKIDRSVLGELAQTHGDGAMVKALIDLGHNLKKTVVAQGVEQEHQLTYLRQEGCDEIQGYYCSQPLPAEAVAQRMLQEKE